MIDRTVVGNLFAWACQVGLIAIVAACMLSLFRVDAPSLRYAWWRLVLVVCLLLPAVQPWRVIEMPPPAPEPMSAGELALGGSAVSGESAAPQKNRPETSDSRVLWPAMIAIALVAGAVLRLAWLGAGLLRLRGLRQAGERAAPCDGHDELAKLIEAGAEIRYVHVIGQPVTFGLRRPVVLLPDTLRTLPDSVQRAILAHELWHVRRRDWIWILTEEVLRALLWFHPAISFVISRVQSAREEVVDELTVLLTNSRRSYLEALLAFADKPALFAAAPFARRRHLFQRMLLISREGVMSSKRIVMSGAAMSMALVGTISAGAASFPLTVTPQPQTTVAAATPQQSALQAGTGIDPAVSGTTLAQNPPRDPKPVPPPPPPAPPMRAGSSEAELKKALAAAPGASVTLYYELSRLQERRGANAEAEATLQAGRRAFPGHDGIVGQLTQFYLRTDSFDKAIAVLEDAAAADPSNPAGHHRVATFYEEKVRKSPDLSPTEKLTYIQAAIAAEDRALTYNPEFIDALVYKNILLRHQANLETNTDRRALLLAEADTLRNRAIELRKGQASTQVTRTLIGQSTTPVTIDGQAPVRIGGSIKPPVKVRDVRPVYPPEAQEGRVQGVVIIEATIDGSGRVRNAKVLRSIPMLDQAAVDAVMQWEFTPTLLNDAPVPVIMTVTVNFTMQ